MCRHDNQYCAQGWGKKKGAPVKDAPASVLFE